MAIIHIPNSSIFDSKAQTLVNPVNCVGVMGKGLAAEFRIRFPEMFWQYQILCKYRKVVLAHPYLSGVWVDQTTNRQKQIINFPTKDHWRERSYLPYIRSGLEKLKELIPEWGVISLALPALGCGNGGLLWSDVRGLIHASLGDLPFDVEVYLPR